MSAGVERWMSGEFGIGYEEWTDRLCAKVELANPRQHFKELQAPTKDKSSSLIYDYLPKDDLIELELIDGRDTSCELGHEM